MSEKVKITALAVMIELGYEINVNLYKAINEAETNEEIVALTQIAIGLEGLKFTCELCEKNKYLKEARISLQDGEWYCNDCSETLPEEWFKVKER